MTFDEILAQVLDLLQRQGRVSYRALKRRFDLDDEYLEDLKAEIIQAQRLAVDEDGVVLVWSGGARRSNPVLLHSSPNETQPDMPEDRAMPESPVSEPSVKYPRLNGASSPCCFVTWSDSTALAAQLDPEDLREVVQRLSGHLCRGHPAL